VGAGQVVDVRERLNLRNNLLAVSAGEGDEVAEFLRLDPAPIRDAVVGGILEAVVGAEWAGFAGLIELVAVGLEFDDGALPARGNLRVAAQARAAAEFEDDAVELVAEEKVADVSLEEGDVVSAGDVQVDVADGAVGPVADGARGERTPSRRCRSWTIVATA
jgi:hypothetical protein